MSKHVADILRELGYSCPRVDVENVVPAVPGRVRELVPRGAELPGPCPRGGHAPERPAKETK